MAEVTYSLGIAHNEDCAPTQEEFEVLLKAREQYRLKASVMFDFAKMYMAEHECFYSDFAELLAQDESESVRSAVAGNPKAPAALLARLAEDPSHRVRSAVASNPKTTPKLLLKLARDEQIYIRCKVAERIGVSFFELEDFFANTDDETVSLMEAVHPF